MLITERKFGIFKIVNVFFVDEPVSVDIPHWDVVTFHTNKNWEEINGFEKEKCLTTIIDLRQDIEVIWNKIKRQHKRHIRRAEKNGTKVTLSDNYEEFHQIYKSYLIQKGYVDPFRLNIFSSQFMQKYGILFIAKNQGKILGGNLYFYDHDSARLINIAYQNFGNSIDKKKCIYDANCLIQWEAIQYFKKKGLINYDFGGLKGDKINISHQMYGLDYYKLSFGGDIISHYEYCKFNSQFIKFLFHFWSVSRTRKWF